MTMRVERSRSITPTLFLDFDGTITVRDATDAILEAYADPAWLQIEEDWRAGRMGSRQCLAEQMALVTATPEEIDSLLDSIEIDDGFFALVDLCSAQGWPFHIVSDGFDYCIGRILKRRSPRHRACPPGTRIVSNHLEPIARRWRVTFPSRDEGCEHGCATCKPAAMARLNPTSGSMIFVGDGLSDRYAASYADLVFAKDGLAAYCDEHAIAYTRFVNLASVTKILSDLAERRFQPV